MAAAAIPPRFAGRYEIREVLGKGGMGLVYRAYDGNLRREVALKTIRDIPSPAALQLFHKECDVLASMSHPNIVEIFDIGDFDEDGERKPYFVMPLLPGTTLDSLIRNASHRLTVERTVEIMTQTCRGLQAAHERGLVHRDLKPSNIFVMEDDSVKVIDFGVAHMTDAHSSLGQKGTLVYMSPEQLQMKPLSPQSDIFSLSIVCYEALTGRHPFLRSRQDETVEAILRHTPPAAYELNSAVNHAVSRVVHKGMAKLPLHRFSSAKEFSETLNKAIRNQPIEIFDPARLQPRLQRVSRALDQGDYQFAGEILSELEAEGHLDSSIDPLRQQLDQAVRRKTIGQLLDAARARFEEEEDPLALQKVQEILQLDPVNATALGLKEKIEKRRSERQIDNWYKLARQHLDNHAYGHAREALQNVLQLQPRESRAAQMLTEVDRSEQDYVRLRQEKAQLHRAAMEAWQKGDVSSALTKLAVVVDLDRRAPDSADPERSATYQNFYNQVRTEHDAINNAYVEARRQLTERNFSKALALCEAQLSKYPQNALFQALKFDVQEQQRQQVSAFVASVDRQVEGEPDLEKRVNILKEAVTQYPGETHFERSLRLMQDKRDLVNSIVARARLHEEQGQFGDALGDWEILCTIYSQYPGLSFELERLVKRREQQSRVEAKARWIEQIDQSMQLSDYARALELVQKARVEFPEDNELPEMEKLARGGVQRTEEAQKLVGDGQDLCAQGRFPDGIKLLQQAYQLDEHSPLARTVLSEALVDRARLFLDSDWRGAEELVQQALDLNPGHTQAKSLRTLILDRKREEFVGECLSQARRLQAAADVPGALSRIEAGLASYPQETRLLQIRETLQKDVSQTQHRQNRRRDLEELRRLDRETEALADFSTVRSVAERIRTLADKYRDDREFQSAANELLRRLSALAPEVTVAETLAEAAPPGSGGKDLPPDFTPTASIPGYATPAQAERAATGVPAAAKPAKPSRETAGAAAKKFVDAQMRSLSAAVRSIDFTKLRSQLHSATQKLATGAAAGWAVLRRRSVGRVSLVTLLAGAAGVMALVLGVVLVVRHHPKAAALVPVRIQTSPPGATIRINNEVKGVSDLQLDLPAGSYQVDAQLEGYAPAAGSLEAKAGSAASLDLTLHTTAPAAPTIRLSADTGTGKVSIDDQPAVDLEGAQWSLDRISPGLHKLRFAGSQGEVSFEFEAVPASIPVIHGPITATGMHAFVISNFADRLHVYCSDCPAKLSLDGQSAGDVGSDGLELPNVLAGPHQLALAKDSAQHTLDIDVAPAPALTVFLESDQNIGTLLVVTREDKTQVFLNGQLRGQTRGGQLRIPNLEPKKYVVRIAKDGYQDVSQQQVEVRKGEQRQLTFQLAPRPASLAIQGGTPGSAVLLDGNLVGAVETDGTFRLPTVNPGDHTIGLRKDHFTSKDLQKHFVAASATAMSGAEAALEALTGQLKITFQPADATVTVSKAGESPVKLSSGALQNLPPGQYTVTTQTADSPPRTRVVEIKAGELTSLDIQPPSGMADWDVPAGGWRSENNRFYRRGGGFVTYRSSPTSGTFVFDALLAKGRRLQWVLTYTDSSNYELFSMDESFFLRSQVRGGKVTEERKMPYSWDRKKPHTFQIRVSPSEIVTQIQEGNAWVALDSWSQPGGNLAAGKFGFYIPGNDEVALSNFHHYPDLNPH